MVKKIKGSEFEQARNSKVAVVDFSATWCGPCRMLAPVLEQVSDDMAGKAEFFAVDVDEAPDLAMEFGISSIPAVAVLKNGKLSGMNVGFVPKASITAFIEKNMG